MDAFATSAIDNNGIESEIDIVKEEIPLSEAANRIAIDNLARKMQDKERKLEGESLQFNFGTERFTFNHCLIKT